MASSGGVAPLRLFVDESYGADDYYVAGVLVTQAQYVRLVAVVEEIRASVSHSFGMPADVEFHAHRMMQCQDDWRVMRGRLHESVTVYRALLRAVVASGAVVWLEGVDVRRLNARYRYPDSPYEVSLRYLLEKVDTFCRAQDLTCDVTADLIDKADDFREAIAGFARSGTPGWRPSRLERITGPQWLDSRSEPGIQVADLVVYILRRHREVTGSAKAQRTTRSLVHQLRPAIRGERKWVP